jgi:hypothetical protein
LLQVKEGGRHWPRREGGGARARTIIIAVLEEDPHRYFLSCLGHVALEDLGGAVSHRCVDLPCLLERGVKPGHRLVVATGHPARPSRRATIGLSHRAITWPPLARCGLLHGSSDFRDKGEREGNGWIGAKGEDIGGFGREDNEWTGARTKEDIFRRHARVPKFGSLREQLAMSLFLVLVDLSNPYEK